MDLLEDDIPGRNEPEFTVSEISGAVKRLIEGEFGRVRIKGELGRVMVYRSGHTYLDLKDDKAVISGVIWKGQAARMAVKPEEGMEVVATGKLTTFPGQSKYQMVIEDIRPAGVGALMAMLEKRKKQFEAEGLFASERKKPLPYLPEIVGVVTSPQGAVIRDILHRLRDRFPRKVLIWPVAVQGERSAGQVSAAIQGFNALSPGGAVPRPDLIIVARGGGSIEDLWGFNEEIVVRAAAASEIPLISAVGHETDTTLIDHVSDRRAPTPSAAAEIAVPVRLELLATTQSYSERLTRSLLQMLETRKQRLRDLSRALPRKDELYAGPAQKLDVLSARLPAALMRATQIKRLALERTAAPLRPSLLQRASDQRRAKLDEQARGLARALGNRTDRARIKFDAVANRLTPARTEQMLDQQSERFERATRALSNAGQRQLENWTQRLERAERVRQTLGYEATLARGYAVVWDEGKVVTDVAAAKSSSALEIEFRDGRFTSGVSAPANKVKPQSQSKAKPQAKLGLDQGSLFGDDGV